MSAEQKLGSVLQAAVDKHDKTEGPKIDLLHTKLQELQGPLVLRQIDENEFFKRLIDETKPAKTLILINGETLELERTPEGQIKISPQYYGESRYTLAAVVDLDEKGELRVQGIVHYRGKDTKRKTYPTTHGEAPANDEAEALIFDFLEFGDYSEGDYSELVDLPEEESYPVD